MILNLYRSYQPGALFTLPLIVFGLWFLGGELAQPIVHHPLHFLDISLRWINDTLWIKAAFGTLFTLLGALIVNRIFNRHHFIDKDTYLPAFFYSIGLSSIPGNLAVSPNTIALIFILLALEQLMKISRTEDAKFFVFNAGLLFGLAIVLQPGCTPFLLLPWMTLLIIRPFKWREHVIPIIGGVVPLLYLLTYFLWKYTFDDFILFFSWGQQPDYETFYSSSSEILTTAVICFALTVLLAIFRLLSSASTSGLRFKRIIRFVMSVVLVTGVVISFDYFGGYQMGGILFLVIPLSLILPHFIASFKRNIYAGGFFYLGILMVILNFLIILYL